MSATTNTLHPAIEKFAAEEHEWRAIRVKNSERIITDVARLANSGYFMRQVEGASIKDIPRLKESEPRQIDPQEAIAFRAKNDAHYRHRPAIVQGLGQLWVAGFFAEQDDGSIKGRRNIDVGLGEVPSVDIHKDQDCRVSVETDGEVAVRIDGDSIYKHNSDIHKSEPVEWHEYKLPRSTPFAEHTVMLRDVSLQQGGYMRIQALDSFAIPMQIESWLMRIDSHIQALPY